MLKQNPNGEAMFPIQQQISAATLAQLEAQLGLFREFGQTAVESVEKLTQLNLAAARASMEESASNARQMLAADGPQQVVSLLRAQTGPNLGKAIAYGNHLVNIATNAQAEMTRAAEMQVAEASRRAGELVEEAARNAPPGSGNMLALMKAAIGSAGSGYEQMNRSTRRAVQVIESNVNAAVNQIVQPAAPSAND
jgi:phasin family protein